MSSDPEQAYFADGMTDDLITHLSTIEGLFVVSRNSVFTDKGRNVKVETIARDLGVRYVLEGSVRRAGGTLRINAQLTDGQTGDHLWAEIFDRDQQDVFALQDDVIGKIVAALSVRLSRDEKRKLAKTPADKIEAYEIYLRARRLHLRHGVTYENDLNGTGLREVIALYERVIDPDPTFAAAYAGIAIASIFV